MKNLKSFFLTLCLMVTFFTILVGGAQAAKNSIKLAYENHPGEPLDIVAKKWAELVKTRSNGEVELVLYPSSQLGSKKDVLEMANMGVNVMTITDAGFLADYVPDFGILVGPYLADNPEKIFKLFNTRWFQGLETELQKKGLHIVTANWLYGIRHMVTTRPVRSPEDLKGMKIRVPNTRIQMAAMKAMGATPTPMPLNEVYPALTQGVIDGAENPLSVLYGQKLHEPAKFLTLSGHLTMTACWVGGQAFFDTLPAEVVQLLHETGNEAGLYSHKVMTEADQKIIAKMVEEGVEVIESDTNIYRQLTQPVYGQFPEWTPGLYDTVQEMMAK